MDMDKLQNLLYCFNGHSLAINHRPILGERFLTGPHGPLLVSLFYLFEKRKINNVPFIVDITKQGKIVSIPDVIRRTDANSQFYDLFHSVWDMYKDISAEDFRKITTGDHSPWVAAIRRGSDYLEDADISVFFSMVVENGIDYLFPPRHPPEDPTAA